MSAITTSYGLGRESQKPEHKREWLTLVGRKRVLVIVHTVPYGKRLQEVFSLLESDFRIQVMFTAPPHEFGDGVAQLLGRLGSAQLTWQEAVRMEFDLVLAAGPRGVEEIRGPLITLPHGANYLKRVGTSDEQWVAGLSRRDIVPDGRPLPAAVVLPHEDDAGELARHCPAALPVAVVAGDPAHDRMAISLPQRDAYRRALGIGAGQRLIGVVSTWGPHSSFGSFETLLPRLLSELNDDSIRVAVLVHPNVWSGHGPWQVHAWLAQCRTRGIAVVPPEADWRTVLIAADGIIGDHGSVTLYGTLTHAPILLAASPEREINPASPAAALAVTAPTLSPAHGLLEQLDYAAAEYRRQDYAAIAARITSEPGRFSRNMRRLMYRVLGLGQPAFPAVTRRLPLPPALDTWVARDDGDAWHAGESEVPA
ncbi:hypothetical protein [Streptomyces sp. S186]|uniref:hypothetical protein n=1 Tax=Streptomyces sp. S186 TaxID=3434395 RepID=UPI003F6754E4